MRKAAFAGSFDPPTFGHLDIIERSAAIFDSILVVVADDKKKKYLFSSEERLTLLLTLTQKFENVRVAVCEGDILLVDFLRQNDIYISIRGIRENGDFYYESEMARINKFLCPKMETVFLQADSGLDIVRSSALRELVFYKADVSRFAPPEVVAALKQKLNFKE